MTKTKYRISNRKEPYLLVFELKKAQTTLFTKHVGNDPLRKSDTHGDTNKFVIKMDDPMKYAYLAGLIDGEGTITFVKRPQKYFERGEFSARLVISSTDKPLIEWLLKEFGGGLSVRKVGEYRTYKIVGKVDSYYWYISTRKAIELIKKCYPYLIIKKKQAELVLGYEKTIQLSTKLMTRELTEKRLEIFHRLRGLHTGHGRNPTTNPVIITQKALW